MIYTVTFNPALDYIVTVNGFNEGNINRADTEQILPGGKGLNVSMVLNNLDVDNVALGFVAGFTGDEIENRIKKMGCRTEFIHIMDGLSRINVKVMSEIETEINGSGPQINEGDIKKLYGKLNSLKEGDTLVLAGSVPASLPKTIYSDIMDSLQSKGIRFVVDAAGELLMNVLQYKPFLIKPNKDELQKMFNVKMETIEDVIMYAKMLKNMGAINVLVSMGEEGAVLIDEYNNIHKAIAPSGNVVNTVGAGDSMVAGFLAGYEKYGDYECSLKYGIAAGSASAFSKYLATKEEVMSLLS